MSSVRKTSVIGKALRIGALLSGALLSGLFLFGHASAQTPPEALDAAWTAICADVDPDSELYARCVDILNAGPGSGDRRSAAAIGNNFGIFAAQIKVARSGLRRLADNDDGAPEDGALSLADGSDEMLWESERWGIFASAYGSDVRRNATPNENAFNADHWGVNLGADYRFSESVIGLLSIGRRSNDARFDAGNGSMEEEGTSFTLGLYGTHANGFGWQISAGRENLGFDIARRIRYTLVRNAGTPQEDTVNVDATAVADPGGSQLVGTLGADWTWPKGAWSLRVDGAVDYSRVSIDAFTERNGAGFALTFGQRVSRSLRGRVGLEASSARSASWGVWIPAIRFDWIHEFRDDGRLLGARFAQDASGTVIRFRSDDPDRNFGNLSIGVSAVRPNGWQWFIGLDRSIGNSTLRETRVNLGFRKSL